MFRPALSNNRVTEPQNWDELVYGDSVRIVYDIQLESIAQQCFGYHLVKLGALSQEVQFKGCQIKHQIHQTSSSTAKTGIIADNAHLPYAEKSIDAFLLTHVLDFADDPHQVLREIDHCLIPNGQLIIVGFNPFSLAGLARFAPYKKNNPIHKARFFGRSRIKDWLSLLGYEITEEKRFLFADFLFGRELVRSRKWLRFARRYLDFFASVYVIVGKKREFPLSLVKPKWKPVPKFSPVGASIRIKGRYF